MLDGAVAKASGTASNRGAFFDSTADRVSDSLFLGGIAWYLASTKGAHAAMLPFAVLGVSTLVSYERAKAESHVGQVVDRREAGWVESKDLIGAWSAVAAHVLRQRGIDARNLLGEALDGGFGIGDPPAQGGKLDAHLRCRAAHR